MVDDYVRRYAGDPDLEEFLRELNKLKEVYEKNLPYFEVLHTDFKLSDWDTVHVPVALEKKYKKALKPYGIKVLGYGDEKVYKQIDENFRVQLQSRSLSDQQVVDIENLQKELPGYGKYTYSDYAQARRNIANIKRKYNLNNSGFSKETLEEIKATREPLIEKAKRSKVWERVERLRSDKEYQEVLKIHNELQEEIKEMERVKEEFVLSPFYRGWVELHSILKKHDLEVKRAAKEKEIVSKMYDIDAERTDRFLFEEEQFLLEEEKRLLEKIKEEQLKIAEEQRYHAITEAAKKEREELLNIWQGDYDKLSNEYKDINESLKGAKEKLAPFVSTVEYRLVEGHWKNIIKNPDHPYRNKEKMGKWIKTTFPSEYYDKISEILKMKKEIHNLSIKSNKKYEQIKYHNSIKEGILKDLNSEEIKPSILDWEEEIEKLKSEDVKEADKVSQERPKQEPKSPVEKEVEAKVQKAIEEKYASDIDTPKEGDVKVEGDEVTYTFEEPPLKDWKIAEAKAKEMVNHILQSSQLNPDKPIKHTDIDVYDGVAFVDTFPIFLLP